jgi:hypothetical protein
MFYCPTHQNSQDSQSEIPKIFNCEAVFYYYSSIITSSPQLLSLIYHLLTIIDIDSPFYTSPLTQEAH